MPQAVSRKRLIDELRELYARTDLSPEEKNERVYALKHSSVLPYWVAMEGKPIRKGNSLEVVVERAWLLDGWLTAHLTVRAFGYPFKFNNPLMIRNPPDSWLEDESPAAMRKTALRLIFDHVRVG